MLSQPGDARSPSRYMRSEIRGRRSKLYRLKRLTPSPHCYAVKLFHAVAWKRDKWHESVTGGCRLLTLNPFAALLAVIPEPLLGQLPTAYDWTGAAIFSIRWVCPGTADYRLLVPGTVATGLGACCCRL